MYFLLVYVYVEFFLYKIFLYGFYFYYFLGFYDCEFDFDGMCYWKIDDSNFLGFIWEWNLGIIFLFSIGLFGDYIFGLGKNEDLL